MGEGSKRGLWRKKRVTTRPVEERVCIIPGSVEGIADPEDVGVMFFSEGVNLFVHKAEGVDKGGDRDP